MSWKADSWRDFEVRQQPDYSDLALLASVEHELASRAALVRFSDVTALRRALAEAQAGRAFLVQGGDCAESFADFSPEHVQGTASLLRAVARRIAATSGLPAVMVGRLAGQFAKPRSEPLEWRNGTALPSYRGDIVNDLAFEPKARRADPKRMLRAYDQSAATLGIFRRQGADIFASHEALLLPYEEALVRADPSGRLNYGTSGHMLWIGDRTRFPASAHVEFARGIANPIGIKCGPSLDAEALLQLLETLNPDRESGRITLISRMGHDQAGRRLPPLIRAVRKHGHPVLWSCDPMHGNTVRSADGIKRRPMRHILAEARAFFEIAEAEGAVGGGLHIEMTVRDVEECANDIGRPFGAAAEYLSPCDPRLNPKQAMEVAALVAETLANAGCTAPVRAAVA